MSSAAQDLDLRGCSPKRVTATMPCHGRQLSGDPKSVKALRQMILGSMSPVGYGKCTRLPCAAITARNFQKRSSGGI